MNKTALLIVAVAGAALMSSCSSEPSDYRPGQKVSVDQVPPGMRNTANLEGADRPGHDKVQGDMMLNHDEHTNTLKGDTMDHTTHPEGKETTNTDTVTNHE